MVDIQAFQNKQKITRGGEKQLLVLSRSCKFTKKPDVLISTRWTLCQGCKDTCLLDYSNNHFDISKVITLCLLTRCIVNALLGRRGQQELAEKQSLVQLCYKCPHTQGQTTWLHLWQVHISRQQQAQGHFSQTYILQWRACQPHTFNNTFPFR